MSAFDSVWEAAGESGVVPARLDALPPAILDRMRGWLATPLRRGCAHSGPHLTALGAAVTKCPPCAAQAGLEALAARCGGCGEEVGKGGVRGIFAITADLLAIVTACTKCSTIDPKENIMSAPARGEKLTTARRTLTLARERQEAERGRREAERRRRAELVPGPCRVCGALVAQGEGERLPAPPPDRAGDVWDYVREGWVPAPSNADRWRRAHDECASLDLAGLIRAVTGVTLTNEQALLVEGRIPEASQWPWNRTSPAPFGFVTEAEREALRVSAELARATGRRILCSDGACGCCGQRYAEAWFESDLRWADGSAAPVCRECDRVWMRWGGTTAHAAREERQRAAVLELLTGHRLSMGNVPPEGLEPYCRSSDGDPVGHPSRFSWSPRLEELRCEVWAARPDLAPEDRREGFERLHDEQVAAERARRRAEAERETVPAW